MWNFITSQGGHQRFVKWMTGLFVEIKDVKHFKAHPHVMFLDTDVLRSIHKVVSHQASPTSTSAY
jgi:hypothetical protein